MKLSKCCVEEKKEQPKLVHDFPIGQWFEGRTSGELCVIVQIVAGSKALLNTANYLVIPAFGHNISDYKPISVIVCEKKQ